MKKHISLFLAIIMVISTLPVNTIAANKDYVEVITQNAPLRTKADGDAKIVARYDCGMILETTGTCFNWRKLSNWYKIKLPNSTETLYVYAGNVKKHIHSPLDLNINGITYDVCSCGDISAQTSNDKEREEASKVLSSTTLAVSLAASDGFLPVGDIAAATLLIVGTCIAHDYTVPTTKNLVYMAVKTDFERYLKSRSENTCTQYSFRKVLRFPGGLKYIDTHCMDAAEAFVYISLLEGDVYTESEDSALILASMFGSAIMERDKPTRRKDISTYYFHYHVGTNRGNKAHIFFGVNDLKQRPV